VIEGVGVDPAIIRLLKTNRIDDAQRIQVKRFFIKNHKPESYSKLIESLVQTDQSSDFYESFELSQIQLHDDSWRLYSPLTRRIIEKIETKTPFTLDNVVHSFQGIITGNDKAFIFEATDPVRPGFESCWLKPWIKNKDVKAFEVAKPQKQILYTNQISAIDEHPELVAHLEAYREKLKNRRECKNGKLAWYKLQWGRDPDHFERRKIVFPYKATQNRKLYNYYFKSYGKKLGDKLYEYYPNTLLRLGIPDIKDETIKVFKDSYDRIVELKKSGDNVGLGKILADIDQWFYDFFELNQIEIAAIETNR
jgi:adenine-specific DNA-methyltransferase